MKNTKLIALILVSGLLGAAAQKYGSEYVANHAKTPENCVRQLNEHYKKELEESKEGEGLMAQFAFALACADAGNDYELAIKKLENMKNNH